MPAINEFMAEVNQVFGFYFDVSLACSETRKILDALPARIPGVGDDSTLSFGDGTPTGTPDEELKKSFNDTTLRGLKTRMEVDGYDLTKAGETAIVFTFHIWEEKYRGKVIGSDGKPIFDSAIMGDLRLLRNSIIHNKGIARPDVARCKVFTRFKPGDQISIRVHDIFFLVRAIRSEFRAG